MVATRSIREGAVAAAKNEETRHYMVATPSICEGAVSAAKNEESNRISKLYELTKSKCYKQNVT